ncbi:MAG: winged helix-turn-helix transcriptional regulator [Alphaproteobacteria bacterium]|nr:winged helix-turn-helix transcriptional regulator [Alphaproteobacteria bacterium]
MCGAASDQETGILVPGLPLSDFLPYLVNQIANRMNTDLRAQIRAMGLSVPQWRVLAVLQAGLGNRIGDLSKHTIIEQSTLSRVIDQMVRDGLVERRSPRHDNRVVEVHMTRHGRAMLEQVLPIAMAHYRHAVKGLSKQQQAALVGLLHLVLANVQDRFRA